ncbi:cyclin-dependent kinase 2-associated protein 1-like [Coccinella septempunctata]|uniref:cyclin-dependent kinase 2-associated protein 1-like n=1 Tax=Coccinella septempunctata TaxID=41139 RepID=UPI001D07F3B1|nr:cyclin-dependent kinase 2-associated protein 1-like [Coccinella septempunctata]
METVDIQAVESKLSDVTVTAIPMNIVKPPTPLPQSKQETSIPGQSKYTELLTVLEEMGREVRPTYAGSRSSAERLKRTIVNARILVRECLLEASKGKQ